MEWQASFCSTFIQRTKDGFPSIYLSAQPGAGKTIAILYFLWYYDMYIGKLNQILILAPLSAHAAWHKDVLLFPSLQGKLVVTTYEAYTRRARVPDELPAQYNLVIEWINSVDDKWGLEHKPDYYVFDEAHKVTYDAAKLRTTLEARMLGKQRYKTTEGTFADKFNWYTKSICMSGTPADKLEKVFLPYQLLDYRIWDYFTYSKFKLNYFNEIRGVLHDTDIGRQIIAQKIATYQWVLPPHLMPKLPEKHTDFVQIESSQLKIKQMQAEFKSFINYPILIPLAEYMLGQGVRPAMNKIDQAMLDGFVLGEVSKGEVFDMSKIKWVEDFLKDNPKTIVFTMFKPVLEKLRERLKSKCYYVTGGDKRQLQAAIDKADKPLIATYSVKEGANLQGYHTVVFMSLPYSYRDYTQAEARVWRKGQENFCTVKILTHTARDKWVWGIIQSRKKIQDMLRGHSIPFEIKDEEEIENGITQ